MKLLNLFSPILGKKIFQPFFRKLHLFALYGMNYGRCGDPSTSGEYQVMDLIKDEFAQSKNGVFIDCGANVGEYSMALAGVVHHNASIYSFEPSKSVFEQLKKNTSENKNITPVCLGVGEKNEILILYSNTHSSKYSSIFARDMSHLDTSYNLENEEEIKITRLSDFLKTEKIEHINFLKIDVEGNEMNVLKGAENYLLDSKIDMIQFEFGVASIDGKSFLKDFFSIFNDKYIIYRILKTGFEPLKHYHERLEVFLTTNYLAISKSYTLKTKL